MANVFKAICDKNGWELRGEEAVLSLPGGRQQSVFMETSHEDGEDILRIYSVIGDAGLLDENRMRSALGLNYRLRHGALAIRDQQMVLTDTFLTREADHDEVRLSIEYLAKTADQHEKHIYGTDLN